MEFETWLDLFEFLVISKNFINIKILIYVMTLFVKINKNKQINKTVTVL